MNCYVKVHCLSVICEQINHSSFALVIFFSFTTDLQTVNHYSTNSLLELIYFLNNPQNNNKSTYIINQNFMVNIQTKNSLGEEGAGRNAGCLLVSPRVLVSRFTTHSLVVGGGQREPSLFAHMKYESRGRVRPKIRHLAPLDGCACVSETELRRTKRAIIS